MNHNYTYTILKIGLAIMFLVCLADMEYGYYQLVRFVGMVVFFILAFDSYKKEQNQWAIFWFASAILINPLVKIYLGRTIWNIVDVIWAAVLLMSLWMDKENLKLNN